MSLNKLIVSLSIFFLAINSLFAQFSSGKIVYERRTNLYKKYKNNDNMKEWLGEANKTKIEIFELYFNDTLSAFKPQESDERERFSWTTNKNSVYQNIVSEKRLTEKEIWGEKFFVTDSLRTFKWKITDNKRLIAGYQCRKALWKANDSVSIYAWFCTEIINSGGPESFVGLPGMILGLATEDGGIVYFAKSVELVKQDIITLLPSSKKRQKIYTSFELKNQLQKDYGKEKWGRELIYNNFEIW